MMMENARNPVKAVQTALRIVDTLQRYETIGVTELADEIDVSKGTAHCHLATLREHGYVVKVDKEKYKLGLRFMEVAHNVQTRFDIYDNVKDEVERLASESGELALFTVEEQNQGVCLYKAAAEQAVQTKLHVGYRNDLHHTAVGKAILAFQPEAERERFLDETELEAKTERTVTDKTALREELEEIRETGFAYNRGETISGLVGVGAPVRGQNGEVYGAISVIGPTSRMDDDRLEEVAAMIHHAVNVIEINATAL
ncbi:IclR family transcriptional regulator [Haladaptatus sp. DFWS20]|uniref:IclR family transcriptional regulator n=1 Tax=Haladaptatus sp. DFWS20 TaxID=3403467 RepID=UPI003EBCB463